MRLTLLVCLGLSLLSALSVAQQNQAATGSNPFFSEYTTPFKTPPFHLIKFEHYMPAFLKGMEVHKEEIEAIITSAEPPTFENTIVALEHSGALLDKVNAVFGSLRGANTTDELQKIANEVTPLLSKHRDDINLNPKLFLRVKAVYEKRKTAHLNAEQLRLLENAYKDFVRGGANLAGEKKERFRAINEESSMLRLKFEENVLKETNDFKLIVDRQEDLAGLPQSAIDGAAEAAKRAKLEGKWVFTVQKPSMLPFLQYGENRSLREKLLKGYIMRGDQGNQYDNKEIVAKIAALRVERAHLLGYKTHADFVLEVNMAKNPRTVYEFLNKIWRPALKMAKQERAAMQAMITSEGKSFKLEAWDWWYYAEKIRKAKYDLDENELRPYFLLDNVRKGAFDVAGRLYGIEFFERKDIPTYSDEVTVFEVKRKDGSHVGILYTDYFPRPGKRAGAWCSSYRRQERVGETFVTPLMYNVGNFSRPAGDRPALLSLEEAGTLFHEFGHALHGLLSNVTYRGLPVPRDFVELPSQIMENWAFEPEVLKSYARHYKSGEVIPQSLIDKIQKAGKFNQGFTTVEYLAASFLDMDWHTLTDTKPVDGTMFEKKSLDKLELIPEIVVRYRSPYFAHIFSGGYSSGYYSYIWAEVLVEDAFEAFKEKGLFDQATATSFRKNILERGGSEDAMKMYERFRGKKPTIEPLLKKRGLL
ncbi:MAG: M3 family metallopeptidase [Ignavibacteriales bacterium]|nr:M3 family metallopeptidase [Ignavibacteriales bacterium]